MSYESRYVTTYKVDDVIQPFYSGGDVSLDGSGTILASCLGEDAVLTDLSSGQRLATIEGVCGKLKSHSLLR